MVDVKKAKSLNPEVDKVRLILGLTDSLVHAYDSTIAVLEEGIRTGKNNMPLGMMSLIMYADILHGGAFKNGIETLPYYNKKLKQPDIELPDFAKPEQVEALTNSDQPHIFPKVLSDQAYFLVKEWASIAMTVDAFTHGTTALTTLVEGSGKAIKSTSEGAAAMLHETSPILKMLASMKS